MNCPNCHEPVETGSAFCGNCGRSFSLSTISQVLGNESPDTGMTQTFFPVTSTAGAAVRLPSYAVPSTVEQRNHLKATLSVVLGLVGVAGSINMPISGVILGFAGIVLSTMSMRSIKHTLSRLGLVASIISVIAGGATWVYAVTNNQNLVNQNSKSISKTNSAPTLVANSVATPCYSVKFATKLNVENTADSCFMNVFNAVSINQSTDAYKILATVSSVTINNFALVAKQSLEADVKQSLSGFTVTKEAAGIFAASPAFYITADNGSGVSVIEAAVLHLTKHGENFFVLVHAANSTPVDLLDLQLGWQWQ